MRGGSWFNLRDDARATYRNYDVPGSRSHEVGLRLALAPSLPAR